jgi:prepilin-type N-terminal cleavage/methylation domain-containing protein
MKIPHSLTSRRGYTLAEVLIASAILGIFAITASVFLQSILSGFSSMETSNTLKSSGQKALNRIALVLTENKRFFENNANDNAFFARVQLGTGIPVAITGSRRPIINENGSVSPSSGTFVAADVGNSLFFASLDPSVDISALNSSAVSVTNRIDIYHFNYYFVAFTTGSISGKTKRFLREWHSVQYADYTEIMAISDATLRNHTCTALNNSGVHYAFNTSTTSVSNAFFTISTNTLTAAAAHLITKATEGSMMNLVTGAMGGSFGYSVSPNTGGTYTPSVTVPSFASASGEFPSGFEIVATGNNSARQILIRLVLVGKGNFKNYPVYDNTIAVNARDLW